MTTKEQAIANLEHLRNSIDEYCGLNEEGFDTFRMAVEALKQPEIIHCSECHCNDNCSVQETAQAGNKFFCGKAERRVNADD